MLPFNNLGSQRFLSLIGFSEGTGPTTLSAPGANNTKGSWTSLGSTGVGLSGLFFIPMQLSTSASAISFSYMVDLAIGNSSAPQRTILSNYFATIGTHPGHRASPIPIPVEIPPSSTFWARYQTSDISFMTMGAFVSPYQGGMQGNENLCRSATLGDNTSTTLGTAVAPGSSTTSPGSWSDLGTIPFYARYLIVDLGNNGVSVSFATTYYGEIGIKNSTGNYFHKGTFAFANDNVTQLIVPSFVTMFADLPKGYTLAIRSGPRSQTSSDNFSAVVHVMG